MRTLELSERTNSAPAISLLERLSWADKLPFTLLCGLLLGFSSAGYGIWWLAWFALAPLILLVLGARKPTEAALTGLLFGWAYHMVAMGWLFDLFPLRAFGLNDFVSAIVTLQIWLVESLHQSILFCLFATFIYVLPMRAGFTLHYKRPFVPQLLCIPTIWVFFQWVVGTSPEFLGVPIDQLAYGQTKFPAIIQIARVGGAQLVDFALVLANATLAAFVIELTGVCPRPVSRSDRLSDRIGACFDLGFVSTLLFLAVYWGKTIVFQDAQLPQYFPLPPVGAEPAWTKPTLTPKSATKPAQPQAVSTHVPAALANATASSSAASVQASAAVREWNARYVPNIPIAVLQGNVSALEHKSFSATQVAAIYMSLAKVGGVGILTLPAGVIGMNNGAMEPLAQQLLVLARTEHAEIFAGVNERVNGETAQNVYTFSQKADDCSNYVKYRLIPFVDYTPLGQLGALLSGGLTRSITNGSTQASSDYLQTLKSVFGRVGASIGAEIIYPDIILHEVNQGASLLINVSDLSSFHGPMLGQQLVAAAAMRAVENGRYCVVASNTGVSAVIDPRGVVTSISAFGKKGVLFDRVQFLWKRTPFTRMCQWTPLNR